MTCFYEGLVNIFNVYFLSVFEDKLIDNNYVRIQYADSLEFLNNDIDDIKDLLNILITTSL